MTFNKNKRYKSNYLFGRNSFSTGMGSIFNVSGNYFSFSYSKEGEEADKIALQNDWGTIGQDIETAIEKHNKKNVELEH
jgi:hypothetical protein